MEKPSCVETATCAKNWCEDQRLGVKTSVEIYAVSGVESCDFMNLKIDMYCETLFLAETVGDCLREARKLVTV